MDLWNPSSCNAARIYLTSSLLTTPSPSVSTSARTLVSFYPSISKLSSFIKILIVLARNILSSFASRWPLPSLSYAIHMRLMVLVYGLSGL